MSDKEVVYELAYVLRVGESEAAIDEVLAANGATVKHKSPLSQIQLAYPIKKQGVGQFGFYHLTFKTGDAVKIVSDALQLKDSVLRFLVVKVPKEKPRSAPREPRAGEATATADSKAAPKPAVDRLDSLSNEKLSQTLEEILK
jgi:ribosomal protein S6